MFTKEAYATGKVITVCDDDVIPAETDGDQEMLVEETLGTDPDII